MSDKLTFDEKLYAASRGFGTITLYLMRTAVITYLFGMTLSIICDVRGNKKIKSNKK